MDTVEPENERPEPRFVEKLGRNLRGPKPRIPRTGEPVFHQIRSREFPQSRELVLTNAGQLAARAAQAVLVVEAAGRLEARLEQPLAACCNRAGN